MRIILFLLITLGLLNAEVLQVVKLYRPLSLKGTESFSETKEGKVIEAGIFSAPAVVSGAMPEDILAALTHPFEIRSYGKSYEPKECNIFTLSNSTATAKQLSENYFQITLQIDPDQKTDLSQEELVDLFVRAIRNTFTNYFISNDEPLEFDLFVGSQSSMRFTCGG